MVNILKIREIIIKSISQFYVRFFGEEPITSDMDNATNGIVFVAAGDPTIGLAPVKGLGPDELPECIHLPSGEEVKVSNYTVFKVFGSSMSPEDIANGDFLLGSPVSIESAKSIKKGIFAIIQVDPEYYEAKNKNLKYPFKLRHTLYNIQERMPIDELIDTLKGVTTSIVLPKKQKLLREKYEEAVKFYQDNSRQLMLSLTYKEGDLRYSFHPVDLIKYQAEYVLKHGNTGWKAKKLSVE